MKKLFKLLLVITPLFSNSLSSSQCSVDSIPVLSCYDTFTSSYCYTDAFIVDGNTISNFSFYNDDDSSYQEFLTPYIMLTQNTVHFWDAGGVASNQYSIGIWLDYNANGLFEDVELMSVEFDPFGNTFLSGNFFVPTDAITDTVKLRLIKFYGDISVLPSDGCGNGVDVNGEVEDYFAIIQCAASPNPSFNNFEWFCDQQPVSLFVYTDYGYVNWYGDTSVAPVASGNFLNIDTYPGDSTFYFGVGTNGCNNEIIYSILVHTEASPNVVIAGPDTVISCNVEFFTANPGLDNYYWSTGDNTQSISITNGYYGILTVGSDNSFGCYGSDFVFVQIAPLPPSSYVNAIVSSNYCSDGMIYLNYDSLISPGTVDWYDSSLVYLGSGSSFGIYAPDTGIHNFTGYINSVCGLDTANFSVNTTGPPTADSVYSPELSYDLSGNPFFCLNGTITFILLNLNGTIDHWVFTDETNNFSFDWPDQNDTVTFPGGLAQSGDSYSAYAVITNSFGCIINSDTAFGTAADAYNVAFQDSLMLCPFPGAVGINVDYAQYDLLWNTGDTTGMINISTEGMYTLVLTDNYFGCNDSDSLYVMDGNIIYEPFTDTTLVCADEITLYAGTNFDYYFWEQWDEFGNQMNTSGDNYFYSGNNSWIYLEVGTNGGCTFYDTTWIQIAGYFSFGLGADVNTTASSYLINAPGGFSSYLWNTGDNTEDLTVNSSGTYYLTGTNSAGCEFTDTIVVNFLNGISEEHENSLVKIYPNPANEVVIIQSEKSSIQKIEIMDVRGSLVENFAITPSEKITLNLSHFESGSYLMKITTAEKTSHQRLVIMK